jgi:NADPH:quinone reductase-like Zn-dependent oxidoreductase
MTVHSPSQRVAAVMAPRYGGPHSVFLGDAPLVAPGEGEVQIGVVAVSLNRSDLLAIRGEPFFLRLANGIIRPRYPIPGSDVAGRVVAVGPGVREPRVGDRVVGDLSNRGRGGLAEGVNVPAESVVPVPDGVSFAAAASLPTAGVTAYQALVAVAGLQKGERVFLDGASGGVGGYAIQIARAAGAYVVASVGPGKAERARNLGAHEAVDYTDEATHIGTGRVKQFDVIHAINGYRGLNDYQRLLAPEGRFVMTGGSGPLMLQTMLAGRRFRFHTMKPDRASLASLLGLVASGDLVPNIGAQYPLSRTVEALADLDSGHAPGKIIINVSEKGESE